MNMTVRLRQIRGVIGLALISLIAIRALWIVFTFHSVAEPNQTKPKTDNDFVAVMEQRLAPVKAALTGRSFVGYLQSDPAHHDKFDLLRYYVTQYYMAPVVVDQGKDHSVVLVHFESDQTLDQFASDSDYTVTQRFGDGIALIEKHRP